MHLSTSRPQAQKNAILLCTDRNYEKFAFALISQMVDAGLHEHVDICLVSEHDITPPQTLRDLPVRYCKLSLSLDNLDFPVNMHLNFAAYLRLFAITALAPSYEKIVYLDSDIYLERGDLKTLFEIDLLPQHAVAAVRGGGQKTDRNRVPREAAKLGLPGFAYFNSGVMLVVTSRWRDQHILGRALDQIRENPEALHLCDQSALNLTLAGAWSELSWVWNFAINQETAKQMRHVRPVVVHFAGRRKPWIVGGHAYPHRYEAWYANFLQTHYQESLVQAPLHFKRPGLRHHIRMLLRMLRAKKRYRSYRDRIGDEMVAIDASG